MPSDRTLADLLRGRDFFTAIEGLKSAGYSEIGSGNWSRTYRREEESRVIRLTPYDPAFRLFAEAQLADPHDGFIEVFDLHMLGPFGFATVLAYGERVDRAIADAFCGSLPAEVEARIDQLVAEGRNRWTFFGGRDVHCGNVLLAGRLVLTDPVFIDGPRLRTAILQGDRIALSGLDTSELRAFSHLPFFAIDGEGAHYADELMGAVEQLAAPQSKRY